MADIVIPPTVLQSLSTSDAPQAAQPEAKAPPATEVKPPEPTAAQKEKWKLKADGEEFEWDPSDVEATKREIMKARGANKRFEEAAAQRKQAETFFNMLKDPTTLKQVLTDPRIGVDLKKFAEEYVWEQMQEDSLTPEQRRQREIDAELKRYREADAKAKAEAEAKQARELEAHYEAAYEQKILAALKSGGVPNTTGAVKRMAFYMQQAVANNIDLEPADLVAQVRKDLQEEHRAMYSTADASSLIDIVGEELAKKIRSADVKRLKSTQPEEYRRQSGAAPRSQTEKSPKKLSGDEWREELSRKLFGK